MKSMLRMSYISISTPTFVVCRLGNDSQVAVRALRGALQAKEDGSQANLDNASSASPQRIVDVIGGLRAWAQEIDRRRSHELGWPSLTRSDLDSTLGAEDYIRKLSITLPAFLRCCPMGCSNSFLVMPRAHISTEGHE
ncbi:hypothetical protein AG1IA_05513 [Rhizoctonia solani AG-1 IA]|uniref:Rhodanese domain-containing protein n=1 Tax=Thanatephorus cucumeris (strain AG1-IA) TaxID=983506 RepID=L8WUI1_THACA|nr:hypothetical protein AG1IA_05513 [Rhizoctonia solani AG-1 IA]